MEEALRTRLTGNTAATTRVDWGARNKTLPSIRLNVIPSPRAYTMAGAQGTQRYLVQADCYGATFKAARDLCNQVIALLEPRSGSFEASFVEAQRDSEEMIETALVYNRSIDIRVTYLSA